MLLVKKISNLIRARFPYIYMTTYEEDRATSLIKKIAREPKLVKIPIEVYIWTQTNGFVNEETEKFVTNTENPLKALDFVQNHEKDSVFIFYDMHVFFGVKNRNPDFELVRKLRDLLPFLKTGQARKNVFFISPELVIPETLQKDMTHCEPYIFGSQWVFTNTFCPIILMDILISTLTVVFSLSGDILFY